MRFYKNRSLKAVDPSQAQDDRNTVYSLKNRKQRKLPVMPDFGDII